MITSRPMSRMRFWLITLSLLIVWSVVLATSAKPALTNEKDHRNTRNCQALCGHCGCLGFYCGEECICECNNENSDTECIATMQSNARKLNIPFELLLQGSSKNKFVRNALQFEQNPKQKSDFALPSSFRKDNDHRNKRSTIVIYKPATVNTLNGQCEKKVVEKNEIIEKNRQKRGAPLDWFNDLTQSLVRPAPLRLRRKEQEEEEPKAPIEPPRKRSPQDLDRSWFIENSNSLLRPAPLYKNARDNDEDAPPIAAEHFPRVIKDTIRNIQEATGINEDFGDTIRSRMKDASEDIQSRFQNRGELFDSKPLPIVEEAITNMRGIFNRRENRPKIEPVTVKPMAPKAKYNIPWFRPVRFLQRIQDAINKEE